MKRLAMLCKIIAVSSFTMLLSACYGVAYSFKHAKVTISDSSGTAIPGLSVKLYEKNISDHPLYETLSDEDGQVSYHLDPYVSNSYLIDIQDIDGEENHGEFQPHSQEIQVSEESIEVEVDVELTRVE
jgi:hypothetical protein